MFCRNNIYRLTLQISVDTRQLFKTAGVNGFTKAAFLDTLFLRDDFTSKIIFFKYLS